MLEVIAIDFVDRPTWYMTRLAMFLLLLGVLGILRWIHSMSWLEGHNRPETWERCQEREAEVARRATEANYYWPVEVYDEQEEEAAERADVRVPVLLRARGLGLALVRRVRDRIRGAEGDAAAANKTAVQELSA